jgi:hypothetical protein
VPELDGGDACNSLLRTFDGVIGVVWGGEWYDGVLEFDGGVR